MDRRFRMFITFYLIISAVTILTLVALAITITVKL